MPTYFRWFLASLLFGARISETTAKNTYRSFIRHGLTNPQKILEAGWDFLVYPVMREGGYVRYDGRKSTQVLRDCEMLIADYGGRLSRLHDAARDARDVEERLLAFYGVGPVTMNIFLRELRPFWAKSGSRSAADGRETGETSRDRSQSLQPKKPDVRQSRSRPHSTAS